MLTLIVFMWEMSVLYVLYFKLIICCFIDLMGLLSKTATYKVQNYVRTKYKETILKASVQMVLHGVYKNLKPINSLNSDSIIFVLWYFLENIFFSTHKLDLGVFKFN